jgi:hypothetical protein
VGFLEDKARQKLNYKFKWNTERFVALNEDLADSN